MNNVKYLARIYLHIHQLNHPKNQHDEECIFKVFLFMKHCYMHCKKGHPFKNTLQISNT